MRKSKTGWKYGAVKTKNRLSAGFFQHHGELQTGSGTTPVAITVMLMATAMAENQTLSFTRQ